MYNDVKILYQNSCWVNCCYLSGYIAECYCKLLVNNAINSGLTTNHTTASRYGHNIVNLNNEIRNFTVNPNIASYLIDLNIDCSNIISEWDPKNMRYSENGCIWDDNRKATNYYNEINIIIQQFINMQVDGVI